jgi:hypothetical protein
VDLTGKLMAGENIDALLPGSGGLVSPRRSARPMDRDLV